MTHRASINRTLFAWTAVAVLTAPALASAQTLPKTFKRPPSALVMSTLEVREGLGDMTKWGAKGVIDTDLLKQFRWKTVVGHVKFAIYEISTKPLPLPGKYVQIPEQNIVGTGLVKPPLSSGGSSAFSVFTVGMKPVLLKAIGTSRPKTTGMLFMRVVAFNDKLEPLSPVSPQVTLHYAPPSDGTSFGHTMQVRLTEVQCLTETSGSGSDEIKIDIRGASPTKTGLADSLYSTEQSFDTGQTRKFNKLLWEFNGLGFPADVLIIAAVREVDDAPLAFSLGDDEFGTGVENVGTNVQAVLGNFETAVCGDDDCLGWPQHLRITEADWQQVALNKQSIRKGLIFTGLGGRYRLIFDLQPK